MPEKKLRKDKVTYTPTALRDDPALEYPEFHCLFIDQRPAILYTPFDFQSALNVPLCLFNFQF